MAKPVKKKPVEKINPKNLTYSVVIPVYNSEKVVGETIDRIISFFESKKWKFEIILVNDCSPDGSWAIIRDRAENDDRIVAINLIKNYGQHTANIVGFRYVTGDCTITMDDDLQNPPEEIEKLALKHAEGYDLVVGTFDEKKSASYRKLGSNMMQLVNKKIFKGPRDFRYTNFRLMARPVIDRINKYRNHYPYTSGMAMMFSRKQANVMVRHDQRMVGKSNYNFRKLLRLAWSIMFNYSKLPIRILVTVGLIISVISLGIAAALVVKTLLTGASGTGWTSLMLVVSVSNAVLFLAVSILGEYLAVIANQVRMERHFYIGDEVGRDF